MTREDIEKKMHEAAEEIKPLITTLVEALCEAHQKGYLAGVKLGAEMAYPHWIPVEERLPPIAYHDDLSENYLVVDSDGELLIAYYDAKNELWFSVDSNPRIYDVTHWMPLPQPPRKEE